MAAGTLSSRVLGLVSRSLLAALLGTAAVNLAANSFDVANKLPNLIYALVAGGALNAVLVPQIVRADRDGARGREFLDRLFTMAVAGLLLLTVVLTLLAGPLVSLYTAGRWSAPQFDLAVAFALWCLPQLFFYGVYTLFGQLLNARGSFGPYMWAPVVNNVVVIAGLVTFWALFGVQELTDPRSWSPAMVALLAGSATLGVAAQAAVLVWPLRRIGFSWRPRWGLRGVGFRSAGVVAAWTFAGIVVSQLVFLLVSQVGATASAETEGTPEAAVTAANAAWSFAFLLYMLPHGLLAVSLVTAVFTRVSGSAHAGDTAGVAASTRAMMRVLLVGITLPAAGLALFGSEITGAAVRPARRAGGRRRPRDGRHGARPAVLQRPLPRCGGCSTPTRTAAPRSSSPSPPPGCGPRGRSSSPFVLPPTAVGRRRRGLDEPGRGRRAGRRGVAAAPRASGTSGSAGSCGSWAGSRSSCSSSVPSRSSPGARSAGPARRPRRSWPWSSAEACSSWATSWGRGCCGCARPPSCSSSLGSRFGRAGGRTSSRT